MKLLINDKPLNEEECIKYLGVMIDHNLRWKNHINYLSKKITRSLGLLSKIRYFVDFNTLINLYYTFIYSFLTYGLIVWGNTYQSILNPLLILQKRALRIITFSSFQEHSTPLFKYTKILKLCDLIHLHIAIFMYKFHANLLPSTFNQIFIKVNKTHNYNTRLSAKQSYSLPKARTNYGIFSIRFQGPKIWNGIDEAVKSLPSIAAFKRKIKLNFIEKY